MDGILSTDVDIKAGIRCKDIKIKKPVSTSDLTEMSSSEAVTPVGVQFRLRDINKDLVAAWRAEFKDHENVQVCVVAFQLNLLDERKIFWKYGICKNYKAKRRFEMMFQENRN